MPRIKTTRTVNIALFVLRIYLLGMLLLILGKFVLDARNRQSLKQETPPAASGEAPVTQVCPVLNPRPLV